MIDQETRHRLQQMRLTGMADALIELTAPDAPGNLTAVEVVRMAVDRVGTTPQRQAHQITQRRRARSALRRPGRRSRRARS